MNETDIITERSRLNSRMTELLDAAAAAKRSLTAEEDAEYNRLDAEFDKQSGLLEKARKQAQRNQLLGQVQVNPAILAAIQPGEQRGSESAGVEYREAFNAFVRGQASSEQRSLLYKESRALSAVTGSAGGNTVPQTWAAQLYKLMTLIDSVRGVATVLTTSSGEQINMPTGDDTSNVGEIIGENTAFSNNADPSFGTKPIKAYKYSSKIILVPTELLQDSAYDIESYINGIAAERLGRIQNTHFTTGTGSSQPTGLVTAATSGKVGTTGQTTSVIYDDLVDLVYSVNRVYRAKAQFMLADSSIKVLRKLKDANNLPIWQPSTQAGQPDSLMGYSVVTNDGIPTMAANAKSILFGDYSKYIIRDVTGLGMVRLNERYAEIGQVGFVLLGRSDGNLLDTAAVKYYQNSAT